jgi:hypothetical protein
VPHHLQQPRPNYLERSLLYPPALAALLLERKLLEQAGF